MAKYKTYEIDTRSTATSDPQEADNVATRSSADLFKRIKKVLMDKVPAILGEIIGTGLLVCLGCMGCIVGWSDEPPAPIHVSLSFGMVVMFLIHIFGAISGAHFNPAITLCALIWRSITPVMATIYVLAQIIGAWLGFGLLRIVTPTNIMYPDGFNVTGVCSTVPHAQVTLLQIIPAVYPNVLDRRVDSSNNCPGQRQLVYLKATMIEFIITGILILVTCACWDPVNAAGISSIPIKFGFTIAAISLFSGNYTGASMNPARTLGPAIWNGDWDGHWVYWVAPLSSSLVCTVIYRMLFMRPIFKKDTVDTPEDLPLSSQDKNTGF